jgi:hypothetical protein
MEEEPPMRPRFSLIALLTLILVTFLSQITPASYGEIEGNSNPLIWSEGSFVPNEILVGLWPDAIRQLDKKPLIPSQTGISSLDQLNQRYGVQMVTPLFTGIAAHDTVAERHGLEGIFKLRVPAGTDIFAMIAEYQLDPAVAYAEPNRVYSLLDTTFLATTPNDPNFHKQWALHNTGQTGGTPDADIDAPEAWQIETGKPSVLIAIIDTGVDYTHPDLAGGRVRQDLGRDFIHNKDDAMDDHGHGTYVAGIAAANTNNGQGMAGVCQGCQIVPVKVLDGDGRGSAETVSQGIQHSAQVGAQILNMSLGYASECGCSETVARTINYAYESGSLLIAASGNNSDKNRLSYPASSSRVLSVGATDHKDAEADFSNRSSFLDIVAPGKDIFSLDLGASYRTESGTSAAAPHVAGVAGLLLSARPTLNNAQLWWILYQSADDPLVAWTSAVSESNVEQELEDIDFLNLTNKVYMPVTSNSRTTFGRLNAHKALLLLTSNEMFAPVDICSSEPSCTPGCGAEVALADQATLIDDLHLLRSFRDNVLAETPIGQHWIGQYEQHRLEVATLLAGDSQLRLQAREALVQWLPLIHSLSVADTGEQLIITVSHIEVAESFVTTLSEQADPQLQATLQEARHLLALGHDYVGVDVRLAWQAFNQQD